jgi:phage major head subunit gpT-like protein
MGASSLSSRAIIGRFFQRLEAERELTWFHRIAQHFDSDQASEKYPLLGGSPIFREWVGGRLAKGFREQYIEIANRHFEATLEVQVSDLRRDKTGQLDVRIDELAKRAARHPEALIAGLINSGHTATCYDGKNFFDAAHEEGESGVQSNDLSIDTALLNVPIAEIGSPTQPSARTLVAVAQRVFAHFASLKDDRGEPAHENARQFLVMTPTPMSFSFNGLAVKDWPDREPNVLHYIDQKFEFRHNPRLGFTNQLVVFRTDDTVKPFIHQVETGVALKARAEGSEFAFANDAHQYGVDQWHNMGYGYWQDACRVTLT